MGIDEIANAGISTIGTLAVVGATAKAAGNVTKGVRGIKTHKGSKSYGGLSSYGTMKPAKKSKKTNHLGW